MRCPGRAIGGPITAGRSRAGIDDREAAGAFGQDCRQPPDAAAFEPGAVDFADRARYIDDGSVVLHHGRPLGARLANSQQLHSSSPGSEGARTIPAPPARTSPPTAGLYHFPQAPGARSARLATRRSARRAVARSGPLCGPAHPMLTPVGRRATRLPHPGCVRRALLSFSAAPEGPPARAYACISAFLPIAQ